MNILNICVNAPYTDGFSYQENLLPKYQKIIGNNVTVLAPEYEYSKDGKIRKSAKKEFIDAAGIRVKRLASYPPGRFKRFKNFYREIEKVKPDIIFCHLFQFLDLDKVIKYIKRHPEVKLYIDSHADFYNSAKGFLSSRVLHGIVWKKLAQKALPFTEKFYGVTPARIDFLRKVYGLPASKLELLPLGADDNLVQKASTLHVRNNVREDLGISENQILILTGGKTDCNKLQTLDLMRVVNAASNENIRLIVFGSVEDALKKEFNSLLSRYVIYVGWKSTEEIYRLFAAADLVVFPGLHSVLWEQAVGMGKPCVFKRIKGFEHIDLGGNCMFFEQDSEDEYIKVISSAIANIKRMSDKAKECGLPNFSYKKIAKKSVGD